MMTIIFMKLIYENYVRLKKVDDLMEKYFLMNEKSKLKEEIDNFNRFLNYKMKSNKFNAR